LAVCSDEAKLHFPRLVALANGYGRMELNARRILQAAYGTFTQKPNRERLTSWFNEYAENHLLLAYTAEDGTRWGAVVRCARQRPPPLQDIRRQQEPSTGPGDG
jgi:hypothetical protein